MKKTILFLAAVCLMCTSCLKSKTCTCKTESGDVFYEATKKTNNKSDLKKFEDECKSIETSSQVNGSTVSKKACEIS